MDNLSKKAVTPPEAKHPLINSSNNDEVAVSAAKRHCPDPGPAATRDGQQPLEERSCEGINPDGTIIALPFIPSSQKDRAAAVRTMLTKALSFHVRHHSIQQKQKNEQMLKKILHEDNFHELAISYLRLKDIGDRKKQLEAMASDFNIEFKEMLLWMDQILNCLIHKVTGDLNLITGVMFVLSRHPEIKRFTYNPEIIEKIFGDPELFPEESDAIKLKISWLFSIVSADMLLMKSDRDLFAKISQNFLTEDPYVRSLLERAELFSNVFCLIQSPGIILLPLNEIWWQKIIEDRSSDKISSSLSEATSRDFITQQLLPEWINAIIFNVQNPYSKFMSADAAPLNSSQSSFYKEKLLIGEEFEYIMPTQPFSLNKSASTLTGENMHLWGKEVQNLDAHALICEKGFDSNKSQVNNSDNSDDSGDDDDSYYSDDYYNFLTNTTVTVQLGAWQVQAKPEHTGTGEDPVIEFTASPYAIDQQFCLGGKQYSAYSLLQKFVIEPAKKNGWIGRSGHKHLDIAGSIGNNAELLFRLLVALENKAWLSTLIQRSHRAKKHFTYITQKSHSQQRQKCLTLAIAKVNDSISRGTANAGGSRFMRINQLNIWWQTISATELFPGPGKINYIAISTPDDMQSRNIRDPLTTIEFRFFHCSRNAEEVQLINQLLVAWLEHLSKQQQDKRPLTYEPVNPTVITHEEAIEKFEVFIAELGLDLETYKCLIRYPE